MKHLEDLTVKELRQAAKELNIKGRSKMNKAELIEALKTRQPKKQKLIKRLIKKLIKK